jgi:predicted nucleic acid-binding protein
MATGYLIDTNVISELRRREPEPRVLSWFEERPARQFVPDRPDDGRDPVFRS